MNLKLDWTTFRRHVQLELFMLLAAVCAVIGEFFAFAGFDESFEMIAAEHGYRDSADAVVLAVMLILVASYLVALFGMLRRKKLARELYLWSLLAGIPLSWIAFKPVSWSGPAADLVVGLTAAISGAILLLAYSRDHGQIWFNTEVKNAA